MHHLVFKYYVLQIFRFEVTVLYPVLCLLETNSWIIDLCTIQKYVYYDFKLCKNSSLGF